jgi:hypothetical protein
VDGVDDICYKCIKGGEFERVREFESWKEGPASARWKKVHACLLHQKRSASRTCPIFSKIS